MCVCFPLFLTTLVTALRHLSLMDLGRFQGTNFDDETFGAVTIMKVNDVFPCKMK